MADGQCRAADERRALVEQPLEEIDAGVAEDLEDVLGVDALGDRADVLAARRLYLAERLVLAERDDVELDDVGAGEWLELGLIAEVVEDDPETLASDGGEPVEQAVLDRRHAGQLQHDAGGSSGSGSFSMR